jgi:RNA polymerase sigma-70 factor (ECF subfamily)
MDHLSDGELLARTAAGDDDAFAAFFRRHERAVLGVATRRMCDASDVADVVADTFLVALRRARDFEDRTGSGLPWLLGIAVRVCADHQRRERRRSRLARRLAGIPELPPDEAAAIERSIDAARDRGAFSEAVDALPAGERAVFSLVAFDGLSPQEAADVLKLSGDAARSRLSRARRKLRARLSPLLSDPEADHGR